MKTLTLDEAFQTASPGPIRHVNTVLLDSDSVIIAERVSLLNAPTEQQKANAALLTHCFNEFREMRDALQNLLKDIKDAGIEGYYSEDLCCGISGSDAKAILAKANTVTLPE